MDGVLRIVHVSPHATVHRNDLIAEIDRPDIIAEAKAAEAALSAEEAAGVRLGPELDSDRRLLDVERDAAAARKSERDSQVQRLTALAAKEGLASLAALEEAKRSLALADVDLELVKERLRNHDTRASGQRQKASDSIQAAKHRLEIAKARQEMLVIRAPIDGIVVACMNPGETVSLTAVSPVVVLRRR
jgi:multidrug resistance efflux pump